VKQIRILVCAGTVGACVALTSITPAFGAAPVPQPLFAKAQTTRFVGPHPDPFSDAPAGKTRVYRISLDANTIIYLGDQDRAATLTGIAGSAPVLAAKTSPAAFFTVSGPHNPPTGNDFIYGTTRVPEANYGFSGSGYKGGTWYHRAYVASHGWAGAAAWLYNGQVHTTPHLGRNSTTYLTGGLVTGIGVTLG
jgi:hypothetical protein